jgi:hypothetical protein
MARRSNHNTRQPAAPRKLYHSELVHACAQGPVVITVLSEAMGTPPGALIEYAGEVRQYVCDNKEVAAFFDGQVEMTFEVMADGGKGEEVLSYIQQAQRQKLKKGAQGAGKQPPKSNPPPKRENAPAAPQVATDTTTAETPEVREARRLEAEARYLKAIHEAKILAGRHTVLAAIASDAAEVVASRHFKKYAKAMPEDRIQGIAMRIMISLDRLVPTLPSNLDKFLPHEAPNDKTAHQPADQDGAAPK